MNATRTSFVEGLRQHYVLLLTLKHDGLGLPSKGSSLVYGLLGLQILLTGLLLLAQPELSGAEMTEAFLLKSGWLIGIYVFVSAPLRYIEVMVGATLLTIPQYVIQLVFVLLGLAPTLGFVIFGVSMWVLGAQLSLLMRHSARVRASK